MTRKEAIAKLAPHQEATDVFNAAKFVDWLIILGLFHEKKVPEKWVVFTEDEE